MKTLAVHCHSDVCSAPGGHSAGCRTSWVCLQHHATVVTSNGVTICGSKFPPTISKHCQHQHSAIHKTVQQYETPTIPAVVISKVLLPQSNIKAAFVHRHSSLYSDVPPGLPTYSKPNVTQSAVYSVRSLAADLYRLLPKMSNCQHTTIYCNFLLPHHKVVITSCNSIRNYELSSFSRIKCATLNQACCQL